MSAQPELAIMQVPPLEMRVYQAVSGQRIECMGQPGQLRMSDGFSAGVTPCVLLARNVKIKGERLAKGALLILDPRVIITNLEGVILYDCRKHDELPEWATEWLDEHPEWPAVLEL